MTVHVVAIDAGNWTSALAVRVTPEQLPFVADHQPVALIVLAKAYVRPLCRTVLLTFHPDNAPARRMYSRSGFVDTGTHRDGQPVWTLALPRDPR